MLQALAVAAAKLKTAYLDLLPPLLNLLLDLQQGDALTNRVKLRAGNALTARD